VQVARTGYTGEDGFELFVDVDRVGELWDALLEAGRPHGQVPVGLGARDTLRLEAGMPLYGNELDRTTNPFEAGLARVVKLSKAGDFVGRAALERVVRDGVQRQLVGLAVRDRGIARHGYPVLGPTTPVAPVDATAPEPAAAPAMAPAPGKPVGVVTSGTMSPTLGTPIAMAYVPPADAGPGTMLAVEVRGTPVAAEVVPLPFYKRPA
jgi:aminomethyltransferase